MTRYDWDELNMTQDPTGQWVPYDEAQAEIAVQAGQSEPVAWAIFAGNGNMRLWSCKQSYAQAKGDALGLPLVPLYTHPAPVRQPLTAEQISKILFQVQINWGTSPPTHEFAPAFVRAIEAAHGIK